MKKLLFVLIVTLVVSSCYREDGDVSDSNPIEVGPPKQDDNMAMGNPSDATSSIVADDNFLMVKSQYVLSYNNSKHTANWASWHLSTSWLGSIGRQDDFRADTTLPSSWFAVDTYGFSGSGFDRGHICPSADRTKSVNDNSATFLMTNMMPQSPDNNQIPWANFEMYCRLLASRGYELYIVAGPEGVGGTGRYGYKEQLSGGVVVPKYTWKVAIVMYNGEYDVARVNSTTRTIAVWMPNDQTASSKPWYQYRVSVDDVESKTGFNFFSKLPEEIQKVIEAKVDNVAI